MVEVVAVERFPPRAVGQLEALDNGKAATIATAVDTAWSADIFRYNAGLATKITGSTVDVSMPFVPGGEFHAYTRRESLGVCGQIVPCFGRRRQGRSS